MYAYSSAQSSFQLNATASELLGNDDYPRQTWWNRTVGPVILTAALAPMALTVLGAGGLLLGATSVAISVTKHLVQFSSGSPQLEGHASLLDG